MTASTDRAPALIDQAQSDPEAVLRRTDELLLEPHLQPLVAAEIHWARGLAARELGDLSTARSDLMIATTLAEAVDESAVVGRIAVSLSIVEMSLGNVELPHRLLDQAEPFLEGSDLGRLLMQRGLLFHRAGVLDDAVDCYRRALPLTELGGDRVAEVRLRLNLGLLVGQRGDPAAGRQILERAYDLAVEIDERLAAMAAHNLGYLDALLGRTPEALSRYTAAESMFRRLGDELHVALVGADRAALLLQAGLATEAFAEANKVRSVVEDSGNVLDLAETELIAARAALAVGDGQQAVIAAARAEQSFLDNKRVPWVPLARLVAVLASADDSDPSAFVERAERLAADLERHGWAVEATHVRVAAARRALAAGQPDVARRVLDTVNPPNKNLPVVDGIAAWTAKAMRALTIDDRGAARRAVTRGLSLLRSNALAVQALDLRAHAVDQGKFLAEIGARLAIADARPREFLVRMEELRGVTVRNRGGSSVISDELADDLAALRVLEIERRDAIAGGAPTAKIDARRVRLETAVRSHRRQATGGILETASLPSAIERLGARQMLAFDFVDGELWAVSVSGGRSSFHSIAIAQVEAETDTLTFALHRLARRNSTTQSMVVARAAIDEAGAALEALLVPARVANSDAPIVVVPAGVLNGLPWRVLPTMGRRQHVVSNSLAGWAVASRREHVVGASLFVAGPDLDHADIEVRTIAAAGAHTRRLTSGDATISSTQAALATCAVAHFACHGTFRSDNPMFSSLRLADGNLTVYDLEQCERLPPTIVMSACNAGQNVALRGGALLGMASALIQLGVSSVIAPLTPVNDERSVDLMVRLHTHLAAGVEPAEALAKASIGPDGELDPTAAPFICFGS